MERNDSLGELFDGFSAIVIALGLIGFVLFPFAIPCLLLTVVFAAPVILAMVALALVAIPPALALAGFSRRRRRRQPPAGHVTALARQPAQSGKPSLHSVTSTRSPGS
jgi:hypothetical protein